MRKSTIAVLCAALLALATPATADEVYPIYFPLAGDFSFADNYGAPRGGERTHIGIDIMVPKMTPVIAAADGTVGWVSSTCCALQLQHADGYESWYIHLNNDTPGTDDGKGWGIAPGVVSGASVTAGQIIGWAGDSGNAEAVGSHLHFELHNLTGPFDPYQSLIAASPVDPAIADEMFFYRDDGLYAYHRMNPNGSLGTGLTTGTGYKAGWDTITAVDLNGDGKDEMFFYRDDGLYVYYRMNSNGSLGTRLTTGTGYKAGWDTITAVDLNGDGKDEMFFYRDDGLYVYYRMNPNGSLGTRLVTGTGYKAGWDIITAVDLNGDGKDEMFFYRDDGLYVYYKMNPNGSLGTRLATGTGYEAGWSIITAVDLAK